MTAGGFFQWSEKEMVGNLITYRSIKKLTAKLKALSAELKIRQNVLAKEALTDLLRKYGVETENRQILDR